MGIWISNFATTAEFEAAESSLATPHVSLTKDNMQVHYKPYTPPHDYSQDYLTTVALEDGTISFNIWQSMGTEYITSISYSTDNGETWTTTNNTNGKSEHLTISVNVNEGDKVLWKGDAQQTGYYDEDYYEVVGSFFSSTAEFDVQGNVTSLLYGDDFKGEDTLEYDYQFARLFYGNTNLISAENLILPATTLAEGCYYYMFNGCTNLTTAPSELPATTLTINCYSAMFAGCTSLTTALELPATTLARSCYTSMFQGCTSLTTAPELPATTLADYCYSNMFQDCTNLMTAPELPATTLANYCYSSMFNGCTSLTTALELPATTLANNCYNFMFRDCTSLNYIKAMFTTTPSTSYTKNWVYGVASSGTFVMNSNASWTTGGTACGVNTYPCNWTVQTASS